MASPRRHCRCGGVVVVESPWWHASAGDGFAHAGTAAAVEWWWSRHRGGMRVRVMASPRRHCRCGGVVVVESPWWHASAGDGFTTPALPLRWSGGGRVTVVACECG